MFLYLTKLGLSCVLPWGLWNPKFSSKTDYVTHIYIYALFCKKMPNVKMQKASLIFHYDLNFFFEWFFFIAHPTKWRHNFKMAVITKKNCKMILIKNYEAQKYAALQKLFTIEVSHSPNPPPPHPLPVWYRVKGADFFFNTKIKTIDDPPKVLIPSFQ